MPLRNRKRWSPPMREFKNIVAVAVKELPNGSVTDIFHSVRRRCPEWAVTPHRVRKALAALRSSSSKKHGKKQKGASGSGESAASRAFPHDIVELRASAGKSRHAQWQWRGQVVRVAGYDDGETAEDETKDLPPGHCSIFWLGRNLEQSPNALTSASVVRVIDRPWVLGDRVAKVDNPLSLGTIVGVQCELLLSDGSSMTKAPVQAVRAVGGFRADDWVASEGSHWVGKIEEAVFRVEVELCVGKAEQRLSRSNGRRKPAVCVFQVSSEGLQGLEPVRGEDVTPQELSPHFPGQHVRAPARLWRQAEWLHGSLGRRHPRRGTMICGMVTSVDCCLLAVRWLASTMRGSKPPDEWVSPDAISLLSMPNSAEGWTIGDHVQLAADKHSPAAIVVESRTVVDVQWADGTTESGVPSLRLCPRPHISAHDFLPNDFVARSSENDNEGAQQMVQPGHPSHPAHGSVSAVAIVVANVQQQAQQQAQPQHQQQAESGPPAAANNTNMDNEFEAGYGFAFGGNDNMNANTDAYGDYDGFAEEGQEAAAQAEEILPTDTFANSHVVEPLGVVASVNLQARTAEVQWAASLGSEGAGETEEVSVFELTEHPQVDVRLGDAVILIDVSDEGRWAGRVCGFSRDGTGRVKLLDGDTKPHDVRNLFVVDDGEGSESGGEGGDGESSTEEEHDEGAVSDSDIVEHSARSVQDENSDGEEWAEAREEPEPNEDEARSEKQSNAEMEVADAPASEQSKSAGADAQIGGSSSSSSMSVTSEVLPFDVCDDDVEPTDHWFLRQTTLGTKALMMAVRREMIVLRKGLLEGSEGVPAPIIVRTFSSRSDLFRAMVVGPPDTPYAYVPFFFDLALPPEYPREPPLAHFFAHYVGMERLNPNLYVDGKVCLSLLGTWSGPSWNPQQSTMLQVLVSLQGLVLVEEPYFNEPGHECDAGTEQGKQASALYNENARLLALRAALNVAQNPPKGFSEIVKKYFRRFGPKLVADCEAALQEPKASQTSEGFRKVLAKTLLPKLRDRWGAAAATASAAAAARSSSAPASEAAAGSPGADAEGEGDTGSGFVSAAETNDATDSQHSK